MLLADHCAALLLLSFSMQPAVRIQLGSHDMINSLDAYADAYRSRWAHWPIFMHAGPLLLTGRESFSTGEHASSQAAAAARASSCELEEPPSAEAINRLCTAMSCVDQLLVHVMSNNGHNLWCHLLRREGSRLSSRLAGVIFDCAGARSTYLDAPMRAEVLQRQALATLQASDVALTLDDRAALKRAAKLQAGALDASALAASDAAFDFQVAMEPHPPTLCLTSADDNLITEAAVIAFAEEIRTGSKAKDCRSRSVRVVRLRGQHVQLLHSSRQPYLDAISAFVDDLGLR